MLLLMFYNFILFYFIIIIIYRPFHTTTLLDAHQCASSSTAETMCIDRVHIVQLYKHSVAIELYRKVYPDALHVASNHLSSCNAR